MGVVYSNRGMRSFTKDVVRGGVSNHEEATKGAILLNYYGSHNRRPCSS